jgi:hypothetical protein
MRHCRRLVLGVLLVLSACGLSQAWFTAGHRAATRNAFRLLPKDMPAFFAAGVDMAVGACGDPDLFALRTLPELRNAEGPEHYLDSEYLKGEALPATRYEFVALCARRNLDPSRVGFVPYTVTEWTERLTVAFAEHRRWPDNKNVQAKCLLYAGILAHYAEDMCQPLHTTVDFDGRVTAEGASPRSGIHNKVDALFEKAQTDSAMIEKGVAIQPLMPLSASIIRMFEQSRALVNAVYAMEADIPAAEAPLEQGSKAAQFAAERMAAAVSFTDSLYVTAWKNSESFELPAWHVNEGK